MRVRSAFPPPVTVTHVTHVTPWCSGAPVLPTWSRHDFIVQVPSRVCMLVLVLGHALRPRGLNV